MNKFVTKLKEKLVLRRSCIRAASAEDIDFVIQQLVDGAKNGHYTK